MGRQRDLQRLQHLRPPLRLLPIEVAHRSRFITFHTLVNVRGKPAVHQIMRVRNETRNSILAESADVADSGGKRRKGLLGRDSLRAGEALWIVPCEAIHTCGMRFPIDVLYLNRHKRVCKRRKNVVPWRISIWLFAHSVLELPAGTIEQTGTQTGDQLQFSSVIAWRVCQHLTSEPRG